MATIRTAIQITDGMTAPLQSIRNALNMTVSSFEAVQRVSGKAIDTGSIQAARAELNKTELAFNEIEQEIREADQAQKQFNNDVRKGNSEAGLLLTTIKKIGLGMGAAFSIKQIVGLSDTMVSISARLALMNDGLQTTKELQDMIFNSAQASRSAYIDTAQVIGKLGILAGHAFSNNKEIVFFAEQMNKQFKIGGAGIQEQTSAMYQLTQAMASGRLQGDEFRSIMENAPLLAQAIAEYSGKSIGELKEMSSEGLITADLIKNAMFAAADETNRKFAELPMTWGQVWQSTMNNIIKYSQPVLDFINVLANNWSTIEPIVVGLAAAVGIYATMLGVQTAATWLASAAAKDFFMTLVKNPMFWIALAIGVVIGMIYKWVQSVGGIEIAWMIASNAILTAWDAIYIAFMKGGNAVMTFTGNMKVGVLSILQDMVNGSIDIINEFINKVNKIPGVGIDAISHVTFATEAAAKNDAAIAARKELISQAEGIAILNATQRKYNIRAAQANVAGESQNDYSSLLSDIAANTGAMKDSMASSTEELKYLRDLAEMEVINRFTVAEVKVDMTNHNNISNNMDLDGVISYFGEALEETIASVAEGV